MNTSQPHNYFLAVDQAPIPFFCGYQKLKNWFQPSEAEIEKNPQVWSACLPVGGCNKKE